MIKNFPLRITILCIVALLLSSCLGGNKFDPDSYVRPLEIVKFSENKYQHISYLKLKQSLN